MLRAEIERSDGFEASARCPFTVWGSRAIGAAIDRRSELVVEDGIATVEFSISNRGDNPVLYAPFEAQFYSGTYYTHHGSEYTIEGDERSIGVWTPVIHANTREDALVILPKETLDCEVRLHVPSDLPNPVEVSIGAQGFYSGADSALSETVNMHWRSLGAAQPPQPDHQP